MAPEGNNLQRRREHQKHLGNRVALQFRPCPRAGSRWILSLQSGGSSFRVLAGGRSPPICRLDRLAIGAVILPHHEVVVAEVPPVLRVHGLLGLDVLRRFRVTFEFDTRTLVLRSLA